MDGTMAAVVLALSLTDMGVNFCPTGCLRAEPADPRWALSAGAVYFQDEQDGGELYLRRDLGILYGPFRPTVGVSIANGGATWVGAGFVYTLMSPQGLYVEGNIMPGAYFPGDGNDLGGGLQFRSGIEVGVETRAGLRYGLSVDHRSNADTDSYNPGIETIQFRVSWRM
jgi:lipid A 3-O-deacylase